MKLEQKAIIDAAAREGKFPMEMAKELLGHDLLQTMLNSMRGHAVAFKNMSQQQQDAAIEIMRKDVEAAVDTAVRLISSQAVNTIRVKLKKMAVGDKYQVTADVATDEDFIHELIDKVRDKSDVLILLSERDYLQGLDRVHGEKDQKDLPLDDKKPAGWAPAESKPAGKGKPAAETKPVEIPAKTLDQAREFVTKQQNGTLTGLQNFIKCDTSKAKAIHDILAAEGILSTGQDKEGNRELIRKPAEPNAPVTDTGTDDKAELVIPDALYAKAKTAVVIGRRISTSFLQQELEVDDATIQAILSKLEADGVISEENEMGGRTILEDA